jgi:hypothetical protein
MPDYVALSSSQAQRQGSDAEATIASNGEAFTDEALLESLVPTFVSLDYQGRVIRLDTFSKVRPFKFSFLSL